MRSHILQQCIEAVYPSVWCSKCEDHSGIHGSLKDCGTIVRCHQCGTSSMLVFDKSKGFVLVPQQPNPHLPPLTIDPYRR